MRYILGVLCGFVLFSAVSLKAQSEYYLSTHIGVTVPSILNQNAWGVEEYDYTFKPKPMLGVNISVLYAENIQLSLGLWKAFLGQSYHSDFAGFKWRRELSSDYWLLPFTLTKRLWKAKETSWGISAGILFAICTSVQQRWTQDDRNIGKLHDYALWNKAYQVSAEEVTHRFVKNDYMLYLDIGLRKPLSSLWYVEMVAYTALGIRDVNAKDWRMPNKSNQVYKPSRNAFVGIKLCLAYKWMQKGRFYLVNRKVRDL